MSVTRFTARSPIPASSDDLFSWHARPGAFARLAPPWDRVVDEGPDGPLAEGARRTLRVGRAGIRWVAVHGSIEPGRGFVDRQEHGPFDRWVHAHRFEAAPGGGSILTDEIEYALPGGSLGGALGAGTMRRKLRRMFRYRHDVTRGDLERHAQFGGGPRLRVAITGASGLVGSALAAFLTTGGHEVVRVVRRREAGPAEIAWDPDAGATDPVAWEGLDAVVHLAGENIAAGRWNPERKRRIRDSRVDGTSLLAKTLASVSAPPRVLVSASAIGWYGDRGDVPVDETAAAGDGFLPEVSRRWEDAAEPARAAGIRVVHPRIGIVLAAAGGALAKMVTPFRIGAGGRLGSGQQVMSWIALDDLVGVLHAALFDDRLEGAVNAVAPGAVTNGEFTGILAYVLRRPALAPAPAAALRLAMGEMADALLLGGSRVVPARLAASGFPFRFPDVESAIRFELGRFLDPDPASVVELL